MEAGYSKIFNRPFSSGATVAEALAERRPDFRRVPVMFCENRAMAQEWTYRWLGACLDELLTVQATSELEQTFADAMINEQPGPGSAVRLGIVAGAEQGIAVPDKGRVPLTVRQACRRSLSRAQTRRSRARMYVCSGWPEAALSKVHNRSPSTVPYNPLPG